MPITPKKSIRALMGAAVLACSSMTAHASPITSVDLELVLAQDVSGSIDSTDFALSRQGIESAFRNAGVISAIQSGTLGRIAVALVDFSDTYMVSVDFMLISDSASSNAFADAVAAATRPSLGSRDGQSNLINSSLTLLQNNGYDGTRRVLDIASEGAQDVDGCTFDNVNCPAVQTARDNFLAGGGTAINAIWLNDRDYFGLDASDLINAFEYGSTNVIGGPGSFQVYASDFNDFQGAIRNKLVREVTGVPEPGTMAMFGLGALSLLARRRVSAA